MGDECVDDTVDEAVDEDGLRSLNTHGGGVNAHESSCCKEKIEDVISRRSPI